MEKQDDLRGFRISNFVFSARGLDGHRKKFSSFASVILGSDFHTFSLGTGLAFKQAVFVLDLI
jgi:hypothetical protein